MEIYTIRHNIDDGHFYVFEGENGNNFMFYASCNDSYTELVYGHSMVIDDDANIIFIGSFHIDDIRKKFPKLYKAWLEND